MALGQRLLTRAWPAIVSFALVAAVLSALLRDPLDDGFPISTYPMFAQPRTTRLDLTYALGVARDGSARSLRSEVVGTDEMLQAAAIYDDAVHGGATKLGPLCTSIAASVARDPAYADLQAVKIVAGSHEVIALLVHGTRGLEHVRWTCRVVRP
ncbi:hypothetical protein BH11MYX1_BH11MYX1_40900 [soil metagenome]